MEENKNECNDTQIKKKRVAWNKGLTKETCPKIAEADLKRQKTTLEKYGVSNVFQSTVVLEQLAKDRHSGALAAKAAKTKKDRYGSETYNNSAKAMETKELLYGDKNYNNREKAKQTWMEIYGVDHFNKVPEQAAKISKSRIENNSQEKAWETIKQKYGSIENYWYQMYEGMKERGTLDNLTSKWEDQYYTELCALYGKEDIIRQYFDLERYPFKCDFYIKSKDKFIEFHGYYTHGPHPFDANNLEDQQALKKLQELNTNWAKDFIYTWTDLDVRKLQTAIKNNLNFETIYIE